MRVSDRNSKMHFVISCFVVIILLAQGSALLFMATGKPIGTWFWPIIDYPMYSGAHEEGDYLFSYLPVEVVTGDGVVSNVTEDDIGLDFFKFYYIGAGISNSSKRSADYLISLMPNGNDIVEIRVYSSPYIITKNGKTDASPKLLNVMTIKSESK